MRGLVMAVLFVVGVGMAVLGPKEGAAESELVAANSPVATEVAEAARTADEQAVYDAVLDYVEGIYDVQPERIERSVHPTMRKFGYVRRGEDWGGTPMTFEQLRDLAATYNANGRIGADAPKEIEVYDVLDKTATAKLTADWGVDYFHLAHVDGRWQIMNVLWQTPPEM